MSSLVADLAAGGAAALTDLLGTPVTVTGVDELPALPAGEIAGTRIALGGTGFTVAITGEPPAGAAGGTDPGAAFADGAVPIVAGVVGVPPASALAQHAATVTVGPGGVAYRCRLEARGSQFAAIVVLDGALAGGGETAPTVAPASFPELGNGSGAATPQELSMLADVAMSVTVELGRARMKVRDLLALNTGSVVELDRAAGAAVDVLVNGTVVARGDVVVIDDELGVRITEVVERA